MQSSDNIVAIKQMHASLYKIMAHLEKWCSLSFSHLLRKCDIHSLYGYLLQQIQCCGE